MKTAGIISEYNPFHNGHAYQCRVLREKYGYDYIIAVMSGDFVQRGAPAVLDKYSRARMALESGVDLVLELPALWSVSSAEFFASAGITLLHNLGIVDSVCYGCEMPNQEMLHWVAKILCEEPVQFKQALNYHLKNGLSFPAARMESLLQMSDSPFDSAMLKEFLVSPNNILAIEYEKAILKYAQSLEGLPIKRTGSDFHSLEKSGSICSATALRDSIGSDAFTELKTFMPDSVFSIFEAARHENRLLNEDDFSSILLYKLLNCNSSLSEYADCTDDISNKIHRYGGESILISELIGKLKSRDLTYTRISRILMHILLDMKSEDYTTMKESGFSPYARILGFRKSSADLLTAIKENSSIPMITKPAKASELLSGNSLRLFHMDIHASDVYNLISSGKSNILLTNDYKHQMEIITS